MFLATILPCLVTASSCARLPAQDPPDAVLAKVQEALEQVAPRIETTFHLRPGGARGFVAELASGLETCDRIDLEIDVGEGGRVELRAWPRVRCARLDARKAADGPGLLGRLEATQAAIAPLAWSGEAASPIHAVRVLTWSEAGAAQDLRSALLALPALDQATAQLMAAFPPPLTEEQVSAKLREAAADAKQRAQILAEIAGYLPSVNPSMVPGRSAFEKVVLNRRGAALDAFRFRVPLAEGDQRLVWAFAYPPGTARSWSIVPLDGDEPEFVRFHQAKLQGTALPAGHATILQRTQTPLRPGAEYLIWFELKVETPVDLYAALVCRPFVASDRDTPAVLAETLGLTVQG